MVEEPFECPVCGKVQNKPQIIFEGRGYCSAKCMAQTEFPGQTLYLIEGTYEKASIDENGSSIHEYEASKKIWAESLEEALTEWLGNPEEDRNQWFKSVDRIEVLEGPNKKTGAEEGRGDE